MLLWIGQGLSGGGGAGALIKIDHLVSASVVAGAGQLVGGAECDPGYEKQRCRAPAPEAGPEDHPGRRSHKTCN